MKRLVSGSKPRFLSSWHPRHCPWTKKISRHSLMSKSLFKLLRSPRESKATLKSFKSVNKGSRHTSSWGLKKLSVIIEMLAGNMPLIYLTSCSLSCTSSSHRSRSRAASWTSPSWTQPCRRSQRSMSRTRWTSTASRSPICYPCTARTSCST